MSPQRPAPCHSRYKNGYSRYSFLSQVLANYLANQLNRIIEIMITMVGVLGSLAKKVPCNIPLFLLIILASISMYRTLKKQDNVRKGGLPHPDKKQKCMKPPQKSRGIRIIIDIFL